MKKKNADWFQYWNMEEQPRRVTFTWPAPSQSGRWMTHPTNHGNEQTAFSQCKQAPEGERQKVVKTLWPTLTDTQLQTSSVCHKKTLKLDEVEAVPQRCLSCTQTSRELSGPPNRAARVWTDITHPAWPLRRSRWENPAAPDLWAPRKVSGTRAQPEPRECRTGIPQSYSPLPAGQQSTVRQCMGVYKRHFPHPQICFYVIFTPIQSLKWLSWLVSVSAAVKSTLFSTHRVKGSPLTPISHPRIMLEKWAWTSRAPPRISPANLGSDAEVMEKSCGAVWSLIYKLTCLMECGIHMSPTRLGGVHADRWMGEVLVGEI